MNLKKWLGLLRDLNVKFQEDEVFALSAQVTYYAILSIFPFLIFLITLISYTKVVSIESLSLLSHVVPGSVYQLIVDVIRNVMATRDSAFLSLGMIATIWSASTGILAFMHGINKAYNTKETRSFWRVRMMSIIFTLGLSLVFIFSFILLVFGEILGRYVFSQFGIPHAFMNFWSIFRYGFALLIMLFVFAMLYFYSPNCRIRLRDTLPGSLAATIGWVILSSLFGFYVNNLGNMSKTYGSLGAIIVLLLWLYWSSIIVLAGNEVNAFIYQKKFRK